MEGKANQILQVLRPKGSTCDGGGLGGVGMQREPGQMEERFGGAS